MTPADPRVLRLEPADVAAFAAASGDLNPLHVNAGYARRTPYGVPIVHGALVVVAALGVVPAARLRHLRTLAARFPLPVLPGMPLAVAIEQIPAASGWSARLTVAGAGLPRAVVDLSGEHPGPPGDHDAALVTQGAGGLGLAAVAGPGRVAADVRRLADVRVGEEISGRYEIASPSGMRLLAEKLGAAAVPDGLLAVLAWSSQFVGMRVPGRDALFTSVRASVGVPAAEQRTVPAVAQPAVPASPRYLARVRSVDPRTGAVGVDAVLDGAGGRVELSLHAFLRPAAPVPSSEGAARYLPPSTRLAGRHVLVVGGSRGLGAAIGVALAAQGATVWAQHSRSGEAVAALRDRLPEGRLREIVADAADPAAVGRAVDLLVREGVDELDGLVLCAGPAVPSLGLHPDAVPDLLCFVEQSLAAAVHPLAATWGRLRPGRGWLAVVSSSAVEDAPEQWPHYVLAKAAVEGLATYCARRGVPTLVLRAPKMWTEMSNGPLGRIGAVPAEQVAAVLAEWALSGCPGGAGPQVLSSAEIRDWAAPGSPVTPGPATSRGTGTR